MNCQQSKSRFILKNMDYLGEPSEELEAQISTVPMMICRCFIRTLAASTKHL